MYGLNPDAARKGDERSGRILEIGAFEGVFKRAEHVVSQKKGTTGIEFDFETPERQTATFSLWTLNKEGKELFGYGMVQALMTCLRVRQLVPVQAMVKKYDRNSNGQIDVQAEVFRDLMGKNVGVLFETEDYLKNDGTLGLKVNCAGFYDAATRLTASEILDKKVQPLKLAQNIKTLKHKAYKRPVGGGNAGHPNAPGNGYAGESGGFADDDIPFAATLARAAWSAI
jgi:hypothetical protein